MEFAKINLNVEYDRGHFKVGIDHEKIGNFSIHLTTNEVKNIKNISRRIQSHLKFDSGVRDENLYKEFTNKLGITPKQFSRCLNAAIYHQFIAPNKDLVDKYGFRLGKRNYRLIDSINKNESLLRQAQKDKQDNLLPILLATSKNPQRLKIIFGKGVWKTICKNSHNKNKVIAQSLGGLVQHSLSERINYLKKINYFNLTTGQMNLFNKIFSGRHQDFFKYLMPYFKTTSLKSINECFKCRIDFFTDTVTMYNRLERKLPKDLFSSVGRYREIHDNIAAEYREKASELNKLARQFDISNSYPTNFEIDGAKATLIKTTEELDNEGKKMHHCVASYAELIKQGEYLVYHLTDDVENATLGLIWGSNEVWELNQMYRECNKPVTSKKIEDLSKFIIQELNKEKKYGNL